MDAAGDYVVNVDRWGDRDMFVPPARADGTGGISPGYPG